MGGGDDRIFRKDGHAVVGFFAADAPVGKTHGGDGVVRKECVFHFRFLKAEDIGTEVRDHAREQAQAQADGVDVPSGDTQRRRHGLQTSTDDSWVGFWQSLQTRFPKALGERTWRTHLACFLPKKRERHEFSKTEKNPMRAVSTLRLCRIALLVAVSLFFALIPARAQAWYISVDGYYGGLGVDTFLDDFFTIVEENRPVHRGGGGRFAIGFGKKWATEFSVGIHQGLRFRIGEPTTDQDLVETTLQQIIAGDPITFTLSQLSGGSRNITKHLYTTVGIEGRYFVFGDFAYDPDVPNDLYFGVGGQWAIPSFWEGVPYYSAIPSMTLTSGYTRRLTRSLFMDFGVEVAVLPTPPSNIVNGKIGLKYAF